MAPSKMLKRPAAAAAAPASPQIKREPVEEPVNKKQQKQQKPEKQPKQQKQPKQPKQQKKPALRRPAAAPAPPRDLPSLLAYLEDLSQTACARAERREKRLARELQGREEELQRETDELRRQHEDKEKRALAERDARRREHEAREERVRKELICREEALKAQLAAARWPSDMRMALAAEVEKRALAESEVMTYRERWRALTMPPVRLALADPSPERFSPKRRRLSGGSHADALSAREGAWPFAREEFGRSPTATTATFSWADGASSAVEGPGTPQSGPLTA